MRRPNPILPADVGLLAMLALVILALLAFASFLHLRSLLMRHHLILAVLAAAAVGLSGCASISTPGGAGEKILQNLEGCRREYHGAIGAGVNGSFDITCEPKAVAPAAP